MTSKTTQPGINVAISSDRLTASVTIRANVNRAAVNAQRLADCAEAAGVRLDAAARERIDQVAQRAAIETGEVAGIVADVRARNAGIEWQPGRDPTAAPKPERAAKTDGDIDHYSRSIFITVKAGDQVAVVRPDADCLDVTGAPFPEDTATTGLTIDDGTLLVNDDGAVTAKIDGVVLITGTALFVSRRLEIPNCVDFSTGNIDFDGSVHVCDGVKDRFVVKVTEDIAVDGLIEGATIDAGGSLCCSRGMVAKEHGTLDVGHNVDIGFLNNVRGTIGRSLNVRGEIMNCELQIARDLVCPTGAIMGGEITVTGKVELGMLGSKSVIPTTLIVGVPGQPGEDLARVDELLGEMGEEIEQKRSHYEMMQGSVDNMTDAQKRDHAEFGDELKETQERFAAMKARRKRTATALGKRRTVDVRVSKRIHPGAVIVVGGVAWRFDRELAGPIQVGVDADEQVVFRIGSGAARPISEVAAVVDRAA